MSSSLVSVITVAMVVYICVGWRSQNRGKVLMGVWVSLVWCFQISTLFGKICLVLHNAFLLNKSILYFNTDPKLFKAFCIFLLGMALKKNVMKLITVFIECSVMAIQLRGSKRSIAIPQSTCASTPVLDLPCHI